MKREWYTYGSTVRGISIQTLKERLSQSLRDRLPKDPPLNNGVCVEASDAELVEELDQALRVSQTKDVVRWLTAEVDHRSVPDYEFYLIDFPELEALGELGSIVAQTGRDFAQQVDFRWPRNITLGIRELANWVIEKEWLSSEQREFPFPQDRVVLLNTQTKDLLDDAGLSGIQYLPLPNGCWTIDILRRVPARADDIILRKDNYDPLTNTIGGTTEFGLRYEIFDFGAEDLQIIDRIEVGNASYRYRRPLLVASRRFVELCLTHKVNRLQFPNILFEHGLVPLLVGRGRITSTSDKFLR